MDIQALQKMLETGRDSAMLRLSLANAFLQQGDLNAAHSHLRVALQQDPMYSAAWKILGKVELDMGQTDAARQTWQSGIKAAQRRGDKQAQKEMQVFLKRLEKQAGTQANTLASTEASTQPMTTDDLPGSPPK